MVSELLSPMNHREIEYRAKMLSGCEIPDVFSGVRMREGTVRLLKWLDEKGTKLFDDDLIMDYGTDCLRLYLLFEKTPKENDAPYYDSWQEGALEGVYKFLGRYRRMALAAAEWNRRGKYAGAVSKERFAAMQEAIVNARQTIGQCIVRGNTLPNRHRMMAVFMELLNYLQKELKIGEIIADFHTNAIQAAVPHGQVREANAEGRAKPYAEGTAFQNMELPKIERPKMEPQNTAQEEAVMQICRDFIAMVAPFAPNTSKVLWSDIRLWATPRNV